MLKLLVLLGLAGFGYFVYKKFNKSSAGPIAGGGGTGGDELPTKQPQKRKAK